MSGRCLLTLCLAGASLSAFADGQNDLARRLEALNARQPFTGSAVLELRLEQTVGGRSAHGDAALRVQIDEDAAGLGVRWEPSALRDADTEEAVRDRDPDRLDGLTPLRRAMTELDASRLSHLLDQRRTVGALTSGTLVGDKAESFQGHDARRLDYSFEPRLSRSDAYHLRHAEGRFTLWIAEDGTPLASESEARYEGKTSRLFGRFRGTSRVTTRYAVEGDRLRVAERRVEEWVSREDGGDVQRATKHFVISAR